MSKYNVIGIMSGTSMDGLDIAYCKFKHDKGNWIYSIKECETLKYPEKWKKVLKKATLLSGADLINTHFEYGYYIGSQVKEFVSKYKLKPDLIASHGHTVFHQPDKKITFQIGAGSAIAAESGILTISDFRTLDVGLGGQGAPLVPIGDKLLFPEFSYCLNLGGFANISFDQNKKRIAFDICPLNIVLNELAQKYGQEYDDNGDLGRKGTINHTLLKALNELPYYSRSFPKSLGKEWVETSFKTVLAGFQIPDEDILCTLYEHFAIQIAAVIGSSKKNVLVTGGGTFNKFLLEKIKEHSFARITLPSKEIIEFKEALIFAF